MLQYLGNGLTEYDENFTPGVKSPADSKYDVRIDVLDPPNQTTFKGIFWFQKSVFKVAFF